SWLISVAADSHSNSATSGQTAVCPYHSPLAIRYSLPFPHRLARHNLVGRQSLQRRWQSDDDCRCVVGAALACRAGCCLARR
ncbi:MAG: hypothetical protein RRB12_12705, partial [Armatimonadota bacterium]|nr:hypothetical protein [Armatimonadota bacterium]